MPWTHASCTTASSACSARRRGCSKEGKYVPGVTFGIASSIVPTRVSHVRVREPLRYAVRSPVRSCRSAPIKPATSDSINACESTRMPSRRTSPSCSSKSLPTNAERSILGLAIVSSPSVLSFFCRERTHGTMHDGPRSCLPRNPHRISTTSWDSNFARVVAPRPTTTRTEQRLNVQATGPLPNGPIRAGTNPAFSRMKRDVRYDSTDTRVVARKVACETCRISRQARRSNGAAPTRHHDAVRVGGRTPAAPAYFRRLMLRAK